MRQEFEAELRVALAEGLLSEQEAGALREEVQRTERGPLALLREQGRLSEDSLVSMMALVRGDAAARSRSGVEDATTPVAPPPAPSPEPSAFPIPGWERYLCVRFLGEGGMGRVFLARDPRLNRNVALKFVRGDAPELTRRFLSEARAQARVNHERVCPVYEVGEVQGRVYIAMRFIEGQSLGTLARGLSFEQKALVLQAACEGVHEAHRVGLIHRDLKPSNILVERAEDGTLRPYVMDFGLARDWKEGATATGAVLGTPHYMSPEQARGEVIRLDRRADVYSLGATLYSVLTGQPPIPGANGLEVLNHIAHTEPRPPRAVDPDIPKDLEAIALKCLEKERSARYDSARAVADELGRFLRGEPVRARAHGPGYRLLRTLRRHRFVASVSFVATLLVLLALGQAGLARREAATRERLARRFTESVERIEALARYSDLSPLHDTRVDQRAIRTRMAALAAEIQEAGEQAAGPGHYALGRGYLALGDEARAREALETAWARGFREPRVAYALALVTGHEYQARLLEAERLRDPQRREVLKREAELRYRDPARDWLRQSDGAEVPSTAYVAALLAFYEDRWDDALARLATLGPGFSWFHEALKLKGDILQARAMRHWNLGQPEAAAADFEAGRKAYAEAVASGESVASLYTAQGELEFGALILEVYGKGAVLPPYTRGLEAVARALTAMPDHSDAWVLEARLHRRLAEYQGNLGEYDEALPQKAVTAARHALELDPSLSKARLELGQAWWIWGHLRQLHSQDPREQLRAAVESFEGLAPEDRDAGFLLNLCLVHKTWADYEEQVGADPLPQYGKAIDACRASVRLDGRVPEGWLNLGIALYTRATQPRDADADADLSQAVAALDQARTLNPGHVVTYFYAGLAHALVARRLHVRGGEPTSALERSAELYRKGIELGPGIPQLHNGLCLTLLQQAQADWDHGADPTPVLARAQAACERAVAVAPKSGYGYINLGEVFAQRALYQRARGEDPRASVRAADLALQQALRWLPEDAGTLANRGMVHATRATFELDHGRDPRPSIARAEEPLRQALARKPNQADAWYFLGETLGARALYSGSRAEDCEAAAQAFRKGIALAPERQDFNLGFGHFLRRWAARAMQAKQDAGPLLQQALEQVDPLIASRPDWPDAHLLRGALLSLRAALPPDEAGQRQAWREQAVEELSRALTANPGFQREWGGLLRGARARPER
ncbi:serine/threonine-protein kinase [Corallococcus sp. Z5C101001]|uniref:serine/threonine-protein kinase n=1 Tax=Corallococcus sp. Z5C101001 TaxID=2596829 RepID=UPI00117D3612|nr:serine/threonine-protein kinase [Corallococcus sp. Z5C101001]TSC33940.1 protein kinase [Corallococcus sp. Z5C101001]